VNDLGCSGACGCGARSSIFFFKFHFGIWIDDNAIKEGPGRPQPEKIIELYVSQEKAPDAETACGEEFYFGFTPITDQVFTCDIGKGATVSVVEELVVLEACVEKECPYERNCQ
jgi:hypothetical protein